MNEIIKLVIKWFFTSFLSILMITFTIIPSVIEIFEIKWENIISHSTISAIAFTLFFLTFGLLIALIKLLLEYNKLNPDRTIREEVIRDSLFDGLYDAYTENRWNEVIKIGKILSRPLWLLGKYELRVKIGRLVESASTRLGDIETQAMFLIDDLGWTNHELENTEEAINNIKHGLKLAKENKFYYLAYKACRHLSGIYLKKHMFDDSRFFHEESSRLIEKIKDTKTKKRAKAGYFTNLALYELEKNNFQEAIDNFNLSMKKYKELNDKDREVKLFHFIGNAYMKWGKNLEAYDIFRQGLTFSEDEGREDGILYNSIGIAKIALVNKDFELAKNAYSKASKVAKSLNKKKLSLELLSEYEKIKKM